QVFRLGIRRNGVVDARIAPDPVGTRQLLIAAQEPVYRIDEQLLLGRLQGLAGEESTLTNGRHAYRGRLGDGRGVPARRQRRLDGHTDGERTAPPRFHGIPTYLQVAPPL